MKLCVIGTGYVGLVTGACFASLGNKVICLDINRARVSQLTKGIMPFYEPGLEALVARNLKAGRLKFSLNFEPAVKNSEVVFICVGTPPKKSGQADVSAVIDVANQIAAVLKRKSSNLKKGQRYKIIVNKSTVPVGMGDIVTKIFKEKGVVDKNFAVVSNPEFLREGSALADFMKPDRIVIGASNNRAYNLISELYRPLNAHIIFTTVKSAELIKYVSNAFLATKISFINEIASICERIGSDVAEVANAVGLDGRIGNKFLNAGIGYGGSCFPKDVAALMHLARENGYDPQILNAVIETNQYQVDAFVGKIEKTVKKIRGKQLAILGLSFKPETDDIREAPALKLIERLGEKGAKIRVYDPVHRGKSFSGFEVCDDVESALKDSEAMIIATEWAEFVALDFDRVKKLLKQPIIFDGRNIYNPKRMKELGFTYHGVGR